MRKYIAIADLKATDKIMIQTQNSTYYFTVIDPVRMSGFLSGGVLLNRQHVAFLRGALAGDGVVAGENSSNLTIESRVVFYLEGNREHLITSAVTRIDLVSVGEAAEL